MLYWFTATQSKVQDVKDSPNDQDDLTESKDMGHGTYIHICTSSSSTDYVATLYVHSCVYYYKVK